MKILQKITLSFLLLILSTNSSGGIYFEPLLGIKSGKSTISSVFIQGGGPRVPPVRATSSYDRTGVFYGARLGLDANQNISFGIDYRIAKIDAKALQPNPSSSLASVEFENTSFGLFLRYNDLFPLWHIWGIYYFVNDRKVTGTEVTGYTLSSVRFTSHRKEIFPWNWLFCLSLCQHQP